MSHSQARLNSVPATCERLSVCRAQLYRLMNSGALKSVKVGRRRLIPEAAITDYITGLMGGSDAA